MVVWFDRTFLQSALVSALDFLHSFISHESEPDDVFADRRYFAVAKQDPHADPIVVPPPAADYAAHAESCAVYFAVFKLRWILRIHLFLTKRNPVEFSRYVGASLKRYEARTPYRGL